MNTLDRIGGHYNASDPKDLVYAFIGMCEKDTQNASIDYNSKLPKVFEATARYLIHKSGNLRLLGHCNRIQGLTDLTERNRRGLKWLPSWVPDWSQVRGVHPIDTDANGNSLGYDACGGFRHEPSLLGNTLWESMAPQLRVRGRCIDGVFHVSRYEINVSNAQRIRSGYLLEIFKLEELIYDECQMEMPSSSSHLSLRRRLLNVLVEQGSRILGIQPEELPVLVDNLHFELLLACESSISNSVGPPDKSQIASLREDLDTLLQCSVGLGSGRRFIRSDYGKLGLAPASTARQDLIAILHGSEVPIILRRVCNARFRVIGQCYLEDTMNGEYVTWKEREASEFILV